MEQEKPVRIPAGDVTLFGDLGAPRDARGIVLFAHGSGSSRLSPRNRHVAALLRQGGLATVLLDLLTRDEEAVDARTAHLRFDIGFLAGRRRGTCRSATSGRAPGRRRRWWRRPSGRRRCGPSSPAAAGPTSPVRRSPG